MDLYLNGNKVSGPTPKIRLGTCKLDHIISRFVDSAKGI